VNRIKLDDNLKCDACGCYGAVEFCGCKVCPACDETGGSCGPEFGWEVELIEV